MLQTRAKNQFLNFCHDGNKLKEFQKGFGTFFSTVSFYERPDEQIMSTNDVLRVEKRRVLIICDVIRFFLSKALQIPWQNGWGVKNSKFSVNWPSFKFTIICQKLKTLWSVCGSINNPQHLDPNISSKPF